jgi:peptidoglycan/LPS O-acetylase OafA/YrhL
MTAHRKDDRGALLRGLCYATEPLGGAREEAGRAGPEKLAFVDGLRGLAILLVMACHVADHKLGIPQAWAKSDFWVLVKNGRYGVALFFVVSAFSLYHSSRARFLSGPRPCLDFYLRRAFRILPAWWLACFAYWLWRQGGLPFAGRDYAMLFGFFRDREVIFDGDWSIFVEATFYAVVPVLFVLVRGVSGALGLLLLACLAAAATTGLGSQALDPGQWSRTATGILAYGPCFAGGVLAYFLWEGRRSAPWKRPVLLLAELSCLAFVLAAYWKNGGLLPFALPLLLLLCSSERTASGRITRARWLGLFGRCSYSIYLFHLMAFDSVGNLVLLCFRALNVEWVEFEKKFLLAFPIVAVAALCVGIAGYRAVEAPSQRLGRWLLAKRPWDPAAAPAP